MKSFLFILAIFPFLFSAAQQIVNLDPLSVTSSRLPQKTTETGRSITVLDAKTIQQYPIQSLDDLLKYTTSVEIQQRGPAGSQADIVIRGGTFQQVLVLLDGIKINDPITGHFSAYMPIAISQIERIEILRGPAAAIYGSEAVGGVINIISKTFSSFIKEKNSKGNASVAAGEYGYLSANAEFTKTNKRVNYSLAAQTANANGQMLRANNRGYFNNHLFSANAAMELKKNWRLLFHSSFDSRDFAAQNFYTGFISDTATEKVNTWWNHVKLKHTTYNSSDELDLTYKNTFDQYVFNPKAIANKNKSGLILLQYLHSKTVSAAFFYNYGILAEEKTIQSNDRGNHHNTNIAGFGSFIYKVKKLTLGSGLRLVNDRNYGTAFLPQANLAYRTGIVVFKINAGRAIRSADFTERYNNYNKTIVNSGNIGNPNLNAEKSWSYETGADLVLPNLRISGTVFYRNQDEVIDWTPTPYADMPRKINLAPTGSFALAKNIKKVNTSGIELDINYSRRFNSNQQLYITASATFLHSESSDSIPSFYIISHAKSLLQQTVLYTYKNIGLGITSIYKERKSLEAPGIKALINKNYWLVNAKLDYRFKRFAAFVAIDNIGNIEYSDLLGSRMPGSWTKAGLSVSF
jgi:iron complex outermembrane receptor protein